MAIIRFGHVECVPPIIFPYINNSKTRDNGVYENCCPGNTAPIHDSCMNNGWIAICEMSNIVFNAKVFFGARFFFRFDFFLNLWSSLRDVGYNVNVL